MTKSGVQKKEDTLVWERNLQNLAEFKRRNGHCNVPEDYTTDLTLARWVKNIRTHKNKLPDWVKKTLQKLKFDFEYKPASWEIFYNQLSVFHQKHHHTHIPRDDDEYVSLYYWAYAMRRSKDRLTQRQRDSLDKLGFEWDNPGKPKSWDIRLKELMDFKKEHGHTIIPKSMKTLHRWCQTIRRKEDAIGEEEKEQLASLGFLWSGDIKKARDQEWEKRYKELASFRKKHGHTLVPQASKLYSWCRSLRRTEKNIAPEKKRKLAELGFQWSEEVLALRQEKWEGSYQKLLKFQKEHGHTIVPPTMKRLYLWCRKQKQKKRYLSEERIERLNKIGFVWAGDFESMRWEKRYKELLEFKEKYGHTTVPESMNSLYLWCKTLREMEQRVGKERKQRLTKIGFRWKKDVIQEKEQLWLKKFRELKAFKKKHGHFRIPDEREQLRSFMRYQRIKWKQGTLEPAYKKMLLSIGFAKNPAPNRWRKITL